MQRYIIGSIWDRADRNGINSNFEYLFEGDKRIRDLVADFETQYEGYEDSLQSNFNGFKSQLESIVDSVGGVIGVSEENVFDGNYYDGLIVYYDDRDELRLELNHGSFSGKTAIIPVQPNTRYNIEVEKEKTNVFRVATDSRHIPFTSENDLTFFENKHVHSSAGDGIHTATVTTTSTDKYMYVYVANDGQEPNMTVSRTVIDQGLIPEPKLSSIRPEHTTFFTRDENIFNGAYYNGLIVRDFETDEFFFTGNYGSFSGKTAIIPVLPNTTYDVYIKPEDTNVLRIGTHSAFHNLPASTFLDNRHVQSSVGDGVHTGTVTTSATDRYMYVYVSNEGTEAEMQVSSLSLNPDYLPKTLESDSKQPELNFSGNYSNLYKIPELRNYSTENNAQIMNDKFISLINDHSDIAEYTNLGSDTQGNNIYLFKTNPRQYNYTTETGNADGTNGTPLKIPKIIITGTVHGSERGVSYFLYEFLKELLENPQDDDTLDDLLANVELEIIPIVNPSGFNAGTYNNHNNANLNRDFPPDGSAIQKETQIVKEFLDNNQDAILLIDAHNMFSRDKLIGYTRTNDDYLKHSTANVYKSLGARLQKEYSAFPQSRSHLWGFSANANVGTLGRYTQDVLNIPSALYEVPRGFDVTGFNNYDEAITKFGAELTFNLIFSTIRKLQ